jgi:serine/threonine protein kinase
MEESLEGKTRWQRLEILFHRALKYPAPERQAQARAWCGDDEALFVELTEMLASDSSVEELLATPLTIPPEELLLRQTPNPAGADDPPSDLWIGRMLGPFRLERLLGRGGMGVVYLGKRTEGFTQNVAIKLIARHLQSGPAVEHFKLERDILARLEHKNIARLLDAGITEEGTPYVAMEYIEGRSFAAICDDAALSLEEKLRLLLQLCEAVAYVHRNLVLHRDLKPGNVLVTSDGAVKLLDFGTLKLLGPAASLSSEMTQAGMRPLTLRYASPEHILGGTVSTASDVYSLGIILYRLVAGHLPRMPETSSPQQYLEYLESEQMRPPSEDADRERPRGGNAGMRMTKDLDAIAMKAIRYRAADRQASVEEFAADIVNALEDRPVAAREGNLRYTLSKFSRRHRTGILSIATVVLVLVAGLGAVEHQGRIATAEAARAEAGVDDERKLTHFLFTEYIQRLQQIPGSVDAQRKAVHEAVSYLDQLSLINGNEKLRLDAIEAYRKMALLDGDPYEQNLGDPPGALASLDKAQKNAEDLKAADPDNPAVLGALAMVARTRSEVLFGIGQTQQAIVSMRSSIQYYDKIVADPFATAAQLQYASNAYNGLGDELGQPGASSLSDYPGALTAFRKDIELSERAVKLDPSFALGRHSIAIAHEKIGQILVRTDPASAIDAFRLSLAERASEPAGDSGSVRNRRSLAINYLDLGAAFLAVRDSRQSIAAYQHSCAIFESYALADQMDIRAQHDLSVGLADTALAYVDTLNPELYGAAAPVLTGNADHAIKLLKRAISIKERISKINPAPAWKVELAYDQVILGTLEYKYKINRAQGAQFAASGTASLRELAAKNELSTQDLSVVTRGFLVVEPASLRNASDSIASAERLVALDHRVTPDYLLLLAQAYRAQGRKAEARAVAREALALLAPSLASDAQVPRTRKLLDAELR